jgi:hypothetical protein
MRAPTSLRHSHELLQPYDQKKSPLQLNTVNNLPLYKPNKPSQPYPDNGASLLQLQNLISPGKLPTPFACDLTPIDTHQQRRHHSPFKPFP